MVGGGLLRDTPLPPPNRGESPVRVVNTATLNQEEANSNIFKEIDDYPANTTVPSAAPGDNRTLPASSSMHPAVSSSATEGEASQSMDAHSSRFYRTLYSRPFYGFPIMGFQ
ncbi:hypothetical protein LIER_42184 [Lithospermum erythrorhizon]|uniref:Uncharacterized protein n=1 Tax=Lithospermum erythrorhizon TaxID=34254 RepID=A0AAV3RLT1_LITER